MVIENLKRNNRVSAEVANRLISEKAARADKAADVWNRHPLFEGKLSKLSESEKRATGINLTNQARFMKRLTEAELSTEFQKMAPTNIMKLVERTYTNINRGNVFATFQMETANDALYYLKHHFSKPFAGKEKFVGRADSDMVDPYGFEENLTEASSRNNTFYPDTRKSVYDSRQDRFANELQNCDASVAHGNFADEITLEFTANAFEHGFIDGYTTIYFDNNPQDVIAFQDQSTYEFFIAPEFEGKITVESDPANKAVKIKPVADSEILASVFEGKTKVNAFARFNSESDFEGETMGEVAIMLSTHNFRPRRTSIGVSWTHLSAITLGASYQQEMDDLLLKGAADVIQAQLDYRTFKEAYQVARTNPEGFTVNFDAAYTGYKDNGTSPAVIAKDGYVDNAQTIQSAIEMVSAAVYEVRQQGAVNNIVAGLSAAAYLKLNAGFTTKGAQKPCGVYRIGELDGIPVYKAPKAVIPTNELLCVFKNEEVDNDAAIVIATLIPFVSNKLDYPNFYTRAGLATYGDRVVLNRNYLGRVVIKNIKDEFTGKDL